MYDALCNTIRLNIIERYNNIKKQNFNNKQITNMYCQEWKLFNISIEKINYLVFNIDNLINVPARKLITTEAAVAASASATPAPPAPLPPKKLSIYNQAFLIWKENMFIPLYKNIIGEMLDISINDRNDDKEAIEQRWFIKNIRDGTIIFSSTTTNLFADYTEYLENPLALKLREYYTLESDKMINFSSVSEYLKYAEKRISDEENRIMDTLHSKSFERFNKDMYEILITRFREKFCVEFPNFLKNNRIQDLKNMFKLVQSANALGNLDNIFHDYIVKDGKTVFENLSNNNKSKSVLDIDPKDYAQVVTSVYNSFRNIVDESFQKTKEFQAALDKACIEFVNNNIICGTNKAVSPEMLAKYTDILLKKNKDIEEQQIISAFDDIILVYKYLIEKDVFLQFYAKKLSTRLIQNLSANSDYEEIMFNKLKLHVGFDFISRIQRMFTDKNLSVDLNTKYQEYCGDLKSDLKSDPKGDLKGDSLKNDGDTKLDPVLVLTSMCWPIPQATIPFILPPVLDSGVKTFTKFYNKQHANRKLIWMNQLSRVDLITPFLSKKAKIIFDIPLILATLLIHFNDSPSTTMGACFDKILISLISVIVFI